MGRLNKFADESGPLNPGRSMANEPAFPFLSMPL